MRFCFRVSLLFITLFSVVALNGCGSPHEKGRSGKKLNYDNWLLGGQIANNGYAGGEVLALALDGMRYRSRIDENQAFGIQLPGNASYALYFLAPTDYDYDINADDNFAGVASTTHGVGTEALLNYEESPDIGIRDTLRLPKVLFQNTINLGQVDIKEGRAFPTINPSQIMDFDNDGINDFADLDDQNDGLSDREQQQSTDRVEICHFSDRHEGKTLNVLLSELFNHVEDGDTLGPCIATRASSHDEEALKPVNMAPQSPIPPQRSVAPQAVNPQRPSPFMPVPKPRAPRPLHDDDADEHDDKDEKGNDDDANDSNDEEEDDKDVEKDEDEVKKPPKKHPSSKTSRKHVRFKLRAS